MVATVTQAQLVRLREGIIHLLKETQPCKQAVVRRTISESYYQQKLLELELMYSHFELAEQTLGTSVICAFYETTFHRWKRDVRWLHRFRRNPAIL